MEFDLEDPLTSFKEHQSDTIPVLFATESDHMPSHNNLHSLITSEFHVSFRREAISLILQAQFSGNFDPFIPYLAVNYMDRFISKQEMPKGKPWVLRLLVTSCLSLAAKMRNTLFVPSDLQREEGFIFDAQTIHRMELLILDALNWRTRSVTPFSFVFFFISLSELKDPPLTQALKVRASEIIFKAQNEIKLLEFKPSIIAASAVLSASHELFPLQFPSFRSSILSCEYVNKENLFKCFTEMQEMLVMEGYESMLDTVSSTRTPLTVLDCHCTTSESENTTTATRSFNAATLMPEKRDIKRGKLNGLCSENRFKLSQLHQSQ